MDQRLEAVAKGALRRLTPGTEAPPRPSSGKGELRLDKLSLEQLRNLAGLHLEDPLVGSVVDALRSGRPVLLDRAAVERSLELRDYPPRLREQFARWFSRIAGYGVALVGQDAGPPVESPLPTPPSAPVREEGETVCAFSEMSPDQEILAAILGEVECDGKSCVLEPGKVCDGSGRCKTLGF